MEEAMRLWKLSPIEQCARDVIAHSHPIKTPQAIEHVVLFMAAQEQDVRRAIERLIDQGYVEYDVSFSLHPTRR